MSVSLGWRWQCDICDYCTRYLVKAEKCENSHFGPTLTDNIDVDNDDDGKDDDGRRCCYSPSSAALLEPSKTGMYVKYPYRGDAYQYALPKMGTYVKYPYPRVHGSSTLVTLPT